MVHGRDVVAADEVCQVLGWAFEAQFGTNVEDLLAVTFADGLDEPKVR